MANDGVRIVPLDRCGNLGLTAFPPDTEWILIGRDRSWTLQKGVRSLRQMDREGVVVFPSNATEVARRHLVLRKEPSGNWSAVPQASSEATPYYTSVDGVPADGPVALRSGSLIRLGKTSGPALRFETPRRQKSALMSGLTTMVQDPVPTWRNAVRSLRMHLAATATVLLLLIAGTSYWLYEKYFHLELRVTAQEESLAALRKSFEQEVAEAEKRAMEARPAGFDRETVAMLQDAAHVVAIRGPNGLRPIATAWPIAPDRVVTNAHVVEHIKAFKRENPSADAVICATGAMTDCVEIAGEPTTHLAFSDFRQYVKGLNPGSLAADDSFSRSEFPCAYDVGILQLAPGADVGPILTPASPSEYLDLHVGTPIAFAGYLLRGVDGVVPRVHFGTVSALTDFLMTEPPNGNPARAQLVHNTIPVTGGASGGPVINSAGKVVAILSCGTVIDISNGDGPATSAPSAALVNYAQRVDILSQLDVASMFDVSEEQRYWDRQTAQFLSYRDYLVRTFLEAPSAYDTRRMAAWQQQTYAIDDRYDATEATFEVEKGKRYAVLAYAGAAAQLSLRIQIRADEAAGRAAGERPVKELTPEPGRASRETFVAKADGEATVVIRSSATAPSTFELMIYRSE